MKHFYFPLIFSLIGLVVFSQNGISPTPIEVKLAKDLRVKYDKSDVAILKSKEKISFSYNKKSKLVEVSQLTSETLLNINHRADIHKYEFYDSQSEISTFSIKYKNNKKTSFYPFDEFYKSEDLFYNDARVKYYKIDFPVQGYKYLYKLEKKIKDVKYFTSIYFNDEFPVIEKEVEIIIPNWLNLEIKEFNFNSHNITKKEITTPQYTKITYFIKELETGKDENNTKGPSFLYPHILFIAKSFKNDDKFTRLFEGTSDLYKWYKGLIDSMNEKPEEYQDFVNEITKDAKTDLEQIKAIYYWVQDNIRYIAFEDGIAGFKPDDSQNVFNKRYGDCKGMANLLKQMLKLKGFDARLCWIGTNRIAYDYSIPSLSVDNHMICALFKDNKRFFLDGTEKYNTLGDYAERIQGKQVLIEDGDNFILDRIPTQNASINKEKTIINLLIKDESLKGHVKQELKGQSKASFLYQYNTIKNNKKEEALNWYLSSGDKNYNVSNISTSDISNRDNDLNLEYDVSIFNSVSKFDNEIYIDIDYAKEYNSLNLKEREKDLVFSHKTFIDTEIYLQIPQGYKVTKLPKGINSKNSQFEVSISFKEENNKIIYQKKILFPEGKLDKENFESWKKVHETLSESYTEQIVLTK